MLHTLSSDQLYDRVVDKFFADNPQLMRGERMPAPVALAQGGTIIVDQFIEPTSEMVLRVRRPMKVTYEEDGSLPDMKMDAHGWCYPYQVLAPFAHEFGVLNKSVGEKTM